MNNNSSEPLVRVDSAPLSAMAEVERSRATQQVQAAYVMAKRFPRDQHAALVRILSACQRYGLAERAFYSFPRGKESITGGSIRLAEALAQSWGNLDFGVVELEKTNGRSVAESFCVDLETNVRQTKIFTVEHELRLSGGAMKKLVDPRDIYEHVANHAARRLRAVIFGVIPVDIREEAEKEARKTLARGRLDPDGKPIETIAQRVSRMLLAFKAAGVGQEMIERRLGHKIDLTTGDELVDLQAIYNSIKDKQGRRGDYFDFPDDAPPEGRAAELKAKLRAEAGGGQ